MTKEYYQRNRARVLAHQKRLYQANRDRKLAYQKAYYERNRERQLQLVKDRYDSRKRLDYELRRHYGITETQFFDLLIEQRGECAICFKAFGQETPHVDHDHITGRIRGLLCELCNLGIGHFRDDPQLLMQAALYTMPESAAVTDTGTLYVKKRA